MKKSEKAALYSGVIFPGAGLWWLKQYWRACIFIVPCGLALIYICKSFYYVSHVLQERVLDGTMSIDIVDLHGTYKQVEQAAQQIMEAQHYHMEFAQYIIILSWIFSIVSSYFTGKKIELDEDKLNNVNKKP
jgi:hypothetical protein